MSEVRKIELREDCLVDLMEAVLHSVELHASKGRVDKNASRMSVVLSTIKDLCGEVVHLRYQFLDGELVVEEKEPDITEVVV